MTTGSTLLLLVAGWYFWSRSGSSPGMAELSAQYGPYNGIRLAPKLGFYPHHPVSLPPV